MSKAIVSNVLSPNMAAQVWTVTYTPVFPFTPASFAVGAVLPPVLYMFRWGHRRGRGKFTQTFSGDGLKKPTIESVAARLAQNASFDGFANDTEKAMLGDLLLAYVLENKRREVGRDKQVQRIFPAHYFASWIDLPESVAHLRGVPEMIVALLVNQEGGAFVEASKEGRRYQVDCRIDENEIVKLFAPGTNVEGDYRTNKASDRFDEDARVGLDQLVTVRLAQECASAPEKTRGKGEASPIPNQHPIATRATRIFREDLTVFLRAYGATIPRLSLLPMLETCMAINLTNLLLSSVRMMEAWKDKGRLPDEQAQAPWPLFVDCSLSTDHRLRQFAEESLEHCRRRLPSLATTLMYLRLLDYEVRHDPDIPTKDLPAREPDATQWLNLLGSIAHGNHDESREIGRFLRRKSRELGYALEQEDAGNPAIEILRAEHGDGVSGWQLAEALTLLMGHGITAKPFQLFLNSCLMLDEPNGIGRRRRVRLRLETAGYKTADVTSVVLSNAALEFLVHRHLRVHGKGCKPRQLSLPQFVALLRERYGFWVDQAPPNLPIPNEMLFRNRQILERRLRDLGLLVGVNDAESMKRLQQRFPAAVDEATE
jgi:hypothetical protein